MLTGTMKFIWAGYENPPRIGGVELGPYVEGQHAPPRGLGFLKGKDTFPNARYPVRQYSAYWLEYDGTNIFWWAVGQTRADEVYLVITHDPGTFFEQSSEEFMAETFGNTLVKARMAELGIQDGEES